MSEYKLSIVVPTFNVENTIDKTFNTMKKQTLGFSDIELIFVDDCSDDDTYNIVSRYCENYENVTVLKTEKNSGFAGKPRNMGLINSNSDYILFLDGDDQLLIDSCAVLYNKITNTNSDIAIGGHINRYENGRLEHIPPMYFGRNEIFDEVIDSNLFKIMPAIGAKLFKKELLEKNNVKFMEGIAGQDLVFFLTCILNSNKINVLNNFYVYYRTITKKSVTFNLNEKYFYGLIKAYSGACDLFEEHDLDYEIQEMLLTNHLGFFTTQVLRAYSSNGFDNFVLNEILNSKTFEELSDKNIFKKNIIFEEFFENMKNGYYQNHSLLKRISDKFNPKLINEYSFLIKQNTIFHNENQKLTCEINRLQNKINNLQNTNNELNELNCNLNIELKNTKNDLNILNNEKIELTNTNKNLKNELDDMKASKLWKLKNKL